MQHLMHHTIQSITSAHWAGILDGFYQHQETGNRGYAYQLGVQRGEELLLLAQSASAQEKNALLQ